MTLLLRSTALTALAARGVVLDVLAFATVLWALRQRRGVGRDVRLRRSGSPPTSTPPTGWAATRWSLCLIGYAVGRLSHTLVRDSVAHPAGPAPGRDPDPPDLGRLVRARRLRRLALPRPPVAAGRGGDRADRHGDHRPGPPGQRPLLVRRMLQQNLIRRAREQRVALLYAVVVIGFALVAAGLMRLQVAELRDLSRAVEGEPRPPRGAARAARRDLRPQRRAARRQRAELQHRVPAVPGGEHARAGAALGLGVARAGRRRARSDTIDVSARGARRQRATARPPCSSSNAPLRDAVRRSRRRTTSCRASRSGRAAAALSRTACWRPTCSATPARSTSMELDSLKHRRATGNGDLIGRTGIERSYEQILRGQDGAEFVVVNADGQARLDAERGSAAAAAGRARPGARRWTSRVQQAMEEAMAGVDARRRGGDRSARRRRSSGW